MKQQKKLISIVSPCFNEAENIDELYNRISEQTKQLNEYDFEIILIDNASTDDTTNIIKRIAASDSRVKLIVNTRNFGHIRSPLYGYFQASGDAVIAMVSDLQDPPELIPQLIKKWESGLKVVICKKPTSKENSGINLIRRIYYSTIGKISDIKLIPDFYGFGIYDKDVIGAIKGLNDPYPYFRGLISELGYEYASIDFDQPKRHRGITKNNFYSLYDTAMLGITSHSKVPLRVATIGGFTLSFISLLIALGYGAAKILFWNNFSLGIAPIVVGLFFFGSVQLFFIGLLGEYIGSIHTQVLRRPLVIEKERVNFDHKSISSDVGEN